jgi:protoporphyrinogen IX oxidase
MTALAPYYLVLKALHVVFMVTWFAGLFYLPRLFIYHLDAGLDQAARTRFETMEKRLFAIMTLGAVLTVLFGGVLLAAQPALLEAPWFRLKVLLVGGLLVFHYRCYGWMARLREVLPSGSTRWLRWFNEIPAFFLVAIVVLAVTKSP